MIENHEEIDELLAGYALQSLSGDDALEADRLLTEHVPDCDRCREMLAAFREVTGDLALATPSATPPGAVWTRIRRSMSDRPAGGGRRWAALALAACLVAVFALGAWNVLLNTRVFDATADHAQLTTMLKEMAAGDGSRMVTLRDPEHEPQLLAYYLPGLPRARLVGVNVPSPQPGNVYRIWLLDERGVRALGQFRPDEGIVWLAFEMDLSDYDEVVITEEPAGATGLPGDDDPVRWHALIYET